MPSTPTTRHRPRSPRRGQLEPFPVAGPGGCLTAHTGGFDPVVALRTQAADAVHPDHTASPQVTASPLVYD
jgi:hypothetical protein